MTLSSQSIQYGRFPALGVVIWSRFSRLGGSEASCRHQIKGISQTRSWKERRLTWLIWVWYRTSTWLSRGSPGRTPEQRRAAQVRGEVNTTLWSHMGWSSDRTRGKQTPDPYAGHLSRRRRKHISSCHNLELEGFC